MPKESCIIDIELIYVYGTKIQVLKAFQIDIVLSQCDKPDHLL